MTLNQLKVSHVGLQFFHTKYCHVCAIIYSSFRFPRKIYPEIFDLRVPKSNEHPLCQIFFQIVKKIDLNHLFSRCPIILSLSWVEVLIINCRSSSSKNCVRYCRVKCERDELRIITIVYQLNNSLHDVNKSLFLVFTCFQVYFNLNSSLY